MQEVFQLLSMEPYLEVSWSGEYLLVSHVYETFTVIPSFSGLEIWLWGNVVERCGAASEVLAYFQSVWE